MFSTFLKVILAFSVATFTLALPIFDIGPTEVLLKEAMTSQSHLSSSIKAFNPAYIDLVAGENFQVSNRLSQTLQNPKVFKEIIVNQQNAVKKAQFQLATLQSLQTRGHSAVSPALLGDAEVAVQTQQKALESLEGIYATSLADRKSASLLKDANAQLTLQDQNSGIMGRLTAWKDRLWAARSISAKDKQLAAIEEAQAARKPVAAPPAANLNNPAPPPPSPAANSLPEGSLTPTSPRNVEVALEENTSTSPLTRSGSSFTAPGAPVKPPRPDRAPLTVQVPNFDEAEADLMFHDASNSPPS